MNVLALDIGGTKISVKKYDADYNVLEQLRHPTESDQDQATILENIEQTLAPLIDAQTQALGISWAGFVDPHKGCIHKAPNIPALDHFPIVSYLEQKFKIPVFLENDARLFAYAESQIQTRKPKVLLGIILGTGVGSGIILDGQIFSGAHHFAGEIGHIHTAQTEIETIISGPALAEYLKVEKLSDLHKTLTHNPESIQSQIQSQIDIFGSWMAGIILSFDPDDIVIGGGAGLHFWKYFTPEIIQATQKKLTPYPLQVQLRFSELDNAGSLGAAYLAWNKTNQNPKG